MYWYSFIRSPLEVHRPVFMTGSRFGTWGPSLGKSQAAVGFLKSSDTELHACFNSLYNCNRTCYCNGVVSVTSASRYVTSASRYQSRYSMHIRGLIPRNSTELAEPVPIGGSHRRKSQVKRHKSKCHIKI